MIRVFDAFSGIGGFRSALERVGGFEIVGWCEIDRFAQKAYKALYDTGGEQFYENIRDIDVGKLADFDLLIGGFPCQPFSVCGARKGFADERGDLFFELADCLKRKDLSIFALKTYPVSWGLTREKLLQKSLKRFLNWGIAWNGVCITAPITFPKSEKEFTLQDVLESTVPEKYWLSEKATARIAGKLNKS